MIEPDALRATADALRTMAHIGGGGGVFLTESMAGDVVNDYRAAADTIKAERRDRALMAEEYGRIIEALTAQRDEAVALLRSWLDAGVANAEFAQRRRARAFLARLDEEANR